MEKPKQSESTTTVESDGSLIDFDDIETNEISDPNFFLTGPALPPRQDISDKSARSANIKVDRNVIKVGDRQFLRHHVKNTDTLSGLSIRYKVKAEDVRSVNKLSRDGDLCTRGYVMIPYYGQEIEKIDAHSEMEEKKQEMRRMIKRFHREFKCQSDSEAQFYLEDKMYDYDAAAQEFREDEKWAKSQTQRLC